MSKSLSVSIAAYNVEQYLRETLDCFVMEKDMEKLEILIVNDGSKDATAEIANEYVEKYPDTYKLINKKNGGWGSTLNAAFECATGKYFKQLDGDDYFKHENLPKFLQVLEETDADMVVTNYYSFEDKTGKVLEKFKCGTAYENNKIAAFEEMDENITLPMHSLTFKTELLQKNNINITEHCFYTDVEYVIKTCCYVHSCIFYDFDVYCYRIARAGQSVSKEGYEKHYPEYVKVLTEVLGVYESANVSPRVKTILRNRIADMAVYCYDIFCFLDPTTEKKTKIMQIDQKLKNDYPEFYSFTNKKIKLLRMTNFATYKLLCSYFSKKMTK